MNKHVEPEQEDKSFQLFGDGTMLIKVDGVMQRRKFHFETDLGGRRYPVPELHNGETMLEMTSGDMEVVTTEQPGLIDVGFGNEEIRPLARIQQLATLLKNATPFNTLGIPPSTVHAYANEIGELAEKVTDVDLSKVGPCAVEVKVDATEARAYVNKIRERMHAGLHAAQAAGWTAYLDAPLYRDMGRSKFNAGVTAAFAHVIDQVLKD